MIGVNFVFLLYWVLCKYVDVECIMDCVRSERLGGYSL